MSERFVCTKENPWSKQKARFAIHPDAKRLYSDDWHSLDAADRYECPNCGHRFWVELPN